MDVGKLVCVRFFTEVEVRRDSVLEKVHQQISRQDEDGSAIAGKLRTLRNHLQDCGGEHETRSQRDEIFEVSAAPVLLDDDESAKAVGNGSGQAKHDTEYKWAHSGVAVSNQHSAFSSELVLVDWVEQN